MGLWGPAPRGRTSNDVCLQGIDLLLQPSCPLLSTPRAVPAAAVSRPDAQHMRQAAGARHLCAGRALIPPHRAQDDRGRPAAEQLMSEQGGVCAMGGGGRRRLQGRLVNDMDLALPWGRALGGTAGTRLYEETVKLHRQPSSLSGRATALPCTHLGQIAVNCAPHRAGVCVGGQQTCCRTRRLLGLLPGQCAFTPVMRGAWWSMHATWATDPPGHSPCACRQQC